MRCKVQGMLAKGMGMSAVTAMRTRAEATSGDLAVTALILGIAAVLWFGWGQADPPSGWSLPLNVGTFAAIAVALGAGGVVARFHRGATAMADPRVRRGYGITVGAEAASCGLGAAACLWSAATAPAKPEKPVADRTRAWSPSPASPAPGQRQTPSGAAPATPQPARPAEGNAQ